MFPCIHHKMLKWCVFWLFFAMFKSFYLFSLFTDCIMEQIQYNQTQIQLNDKCYIVSLQQYDHCVFVLCVYTSTIL